MKVRCITNKIESFSKEILINYSIKEGQLAIKENREYIVYACSTFKGCAKYCIFDEISDPMWYPFLFFDIIDPRLSRYWIVNLRENNGKNVPFLSFPEWANDPYFYTEIVEGNSQDPNAIIFRNYKKLMDLEFPDSSVTESAQIGDEQWLMCPDCIDAWQSESALDALVICPTCQKVFNNPRYKNEMPHF